MQMKDSQNPSASIQASSLASTTYPGLPPPWAPYPTDNRLAWHPGAYGLLLNRAGNFLICPKDQQGCGVAFASVELAADHLKKVHSNKNKELELRGTWRKTFTAICKPLQLSCLPNIADLSEVPPFAGLKVHYGFEQCLYIPKSGEPICGRIFKSGGARSFDTHLRKVHGFSSTVLMNGQPEYSRAIAAAQEFNYHSGYFSVAVAAPPPSFALAAQVSAAVGPGVVPLWLSKRLEEITTSLRVPNLHPGDARVVETWVTTLQWANHLKPYSDWEMLESLVKPPSKRDYPWLRKAVMMLFQEAIDLTQFSKTPCVSLELLRTASPT